MWAHTIDVSHHELPTCMGLIFEKAGGQLIYRRLPAVLFMQSQDLIDHSNAPCTQTFGLAGKAGEWTLEGCPRAKGRDNNPAPI